MIKGGKSVDWSVYASRYDLMAGANPAYQELVRHCCETIMKLDISFGGTVADFGAGTGNFSTALALTLPGITVLHIDSNPDMIQHATRKAEALNLQNWHPIILDLESYHLPLPILQAAVTVHTLYTLKNPREAIARICSNLEPGGYIYAADLGRILNL
ncbi:MAG: class I SAM-dependent methyltransferase, partial [FCB group bacterium]|nr:class I SAM-dependent methyltransferase [FCB group bacterium]